MTSIYKYDDSILVVKPIGANKFSIKYGLPSLNSLRNLLFTIQHKLDNCDPNPDNEYYLDKILFFCDGTFYDFNVNDHGIIQFTSAASFEDFLDVVDRRRKVCSLDELLINFDDDPKLREIFAPIFVGLF